MIEKKVYRGCGIKRLIPVFGIALLSLASGCGAGETQNRDTIVVEADPTPELPQTAQVDVRMSPMGVGPIRTGMRISEIQPKVENLYDTIVAEGGYDSNSYYFMLDGNRRFSVYEFDSGVVNVISADGRSVVVETPGGGELRLGDSFRKVLGLKDCNAIWRSADGEGMWCWNWQGLWFYPAQDYLPDVLAHKLYNQTIAPQASDFPEDVEIGYIGTGLPW